LRLRFVRAAAPRGEAQPAGPRRRVRRAGLLLSAALGAAALLLTLRTGVTPAPPIAVAAAPPILAPSPPAAVWLVDGDHAGELYSNGLRIDDRWQIAHRPRSYLAFSAHGVSPPERRSSPAGIVFHSTESLQAPFAAEQNETLKRIGESLL